MSPKEQSIARVREIFTEAQQLPQGVERDDYIREACGKDSNLWKEVTSLLESFETTCGFLSHDASGSILADTEDLTNIQIGDYKLVECIGEGGFGEVYRAEQLQPFKREVALKIIKLGMDTKEVIARFEVERQALSRMNHPNIAQVYDAGATETGRPYFVMELVHGVPILEYCDRHHLPLPDRIALFQQVCEGVQHAHKKGILHRDLKPSNILISEENGKPLPKIIDFGVAKSLEGRLTPQTLITLQDILVGTPLYMSPEQLDRNTDIIDERSDIYSMGVILYELVAGATPLEHKTPTSMSVSDMRQALKEKELPRPSRRFQSLGRKTTVIANRRGIKPPALERLLRGDLDWIVMKALEQEPDRRYDNILALTEDLERFLNNQPVSAGAPNLARRINKFIRRHNLGTAVSISVGLTILIGAGIMTYSFFHLSKPPKTLLEKRGWKLEKFYNMGELGSNGFGIRPDGSVLIVNEWGTEPKGLYWAKEGGAYSPQDAFSLGSDYVDPEDAIELPEGIYVTDNGPDGPKGTILRVPLTGGNPSVFYRDKIINPYDILIAPIGFDGQNVNPDDLLVFDNGMGRAERAAIWSIDRNSAAARPLIMGNPMADGFLKGGFAPDGSLYTSLNNHENGAVCILRITASGQPEVVLRNYYFLEGKSDKSAGIAVHPITGEVFFSHQKGVSAFLPEKTSPNHFLAMNVAAMHWTPDGSKLYIMADQAIWTLSGPGIESQPVSTE